MSATTAFRHLLLATTALVALVPAPLALAQTLPTGGSVASGSVAITRMAPTALRIDQSSASAVTNWQSFSIGAGARVDVVQPSTRAAMLARVTGNTSSTIAGALTATGQLVLVNPNGIAITPTGTVSAGGGFVASSLSIRDDDFLSGKLTFSGTGASATVSNAGTISVGSGGYAALIGGSIDQSGTISVPLGRVGLGSGEEATLDLSGDGFLQVGVPTGSAGSRALIDMSGTIRANGGRVEIKAAAAREAARHAINLSGVVEARSVSGRNGDVELGGSGGRVTVSGRLDVSSRKAKAGKVTITGREVALKGATIDARGATGGGTVRIAGDRQGKGTLARAETTTIDATTRIDASATRVGDGGSVVVWSDGATSFAGTIVATGGPLSGNGGEAEVSGKGLLSYTGFTDLSAVNGAFGTLLLDPYDVTISSRTDANSSGFTASANDSIINATTLATALGSANVTVSTGTGGTQAGDISVSAPITWSANTRLTLAAAGSIEIADAITATGATAGLVLQYGSGGDYSIIGGKVTLGGANATLSIGTAGALQSYTLLHSLADLAALPATGSFALASDLDTGASAWTPIASFGGTLAGLGHTVTVGAGGMSASNHTGLFDEIAASGTIRDLGVAGRVSGNGFVGALAAFNRGTLRTVWSEATVTGVETVGGLVGYNQGGTITGSWATGAVTATFGEGGGLVGYNTGTITGSYGYGAVSGGNTMGGLVGNNYGGTITASGAWGAVTGGRTLGGLVGSDYQGTISRSYATGAVTGNSQDIGGLIGYSELSTITNVYADQGAGSGSSYVPNVVGNSWVGGLIGYFVNGTLSLAYASNQPLGTWIYGGLIGGLSSTGHSIITDAYFTGSSTGNQTAEYNDAGIGRGSYLPPSLTRVSIVDANGSNGVLLSRLSSYFDKTNVWIAGPNGRAVLRAEQSQYIGNRHQWALIGAAPSKTYILVNDLTFDDGVASGGTFSGRLNGSGHTISSARNALFDAVDGGDIRNLTVSSATAIGGIVAVTASDALFDTVTVDGSVTGYHISGGYSYAGGIVGYADNSTIVDSAATVAALVLTGGSGAGIAGGLAGRLTGTIDRSSWSGSVSADHSAGGLVGSFGGTLERSSVSGSVTGNFGVGGAVGVTSGAAIGDVSVTGSVSGTTYVGGLVGYSMSTTIAASTIDATVTGTNYVGGAAGNILSGAISDTSVKGSVTGTTRVGGLVGEAVFITIAASTVDATVAGTTDVGGLVGDAQSITIAASTVDATVTGTTYVGGLVGLAEQDTSIQTSRAGGAVHGVTAADGTVSTDVGGLVGLMKDTSSVTKSVSTATVDGAVAVGGLVGEANTHIEVFDIWVYVDPPSRVTDSYATGSVSGATAVGGLVGRLGSGSTVVNSWSNGSVSGTTSVGGFVGEVGGAVATLNGVVEPASAASITASYWATDTSGTAVGVGSGTVTGLTGLTTAQFQDTAGFMACARAAGWNFDTVWAPTAPGAMPALYATDAVVWVEAAAVSSVYGDATGSVSAVTAVGGPATYVNGGAATLTLTGATVAVDPTVGVGTGGTGTLPSQVTTATASDGTVYRVVWYGSETATVTARPITVTATAASRVYGDANPALTWTVGGSGLVNGDTLSGSLTTAATTTSGVGTYAIARGTLAASSNYALTYVGADLTVTARPITLTATAASRVYGDTNPALAWSVGGRGLVNGDTLSGSLATAATTTSHVGSYAITRGTLSASANYTVTYVGANLAVTARPITVTATATSRVYGDADPTFGWTIGGRGLVFSDGLTGSLATTATATSHVGTYAITRGTLAASSDYAMTYVGADLTVTARPISLTADAATRAYGDANPALTWTVGGRGLVNGDSLTGSLAATVGATAHVGSYAINRGTLAASSDYTVTGFTAGTLTVTARPITVTATAASRVYGDANPVLGWTIGGRGLVFADGLTGSLATTATTASHIGTYAITQGTLAASSDYAMTYVGGNLTVTARPITVTANSLTRTYGTTNPALTWVVGGRGLVAGDALTGGLTTAATTLSPAGSYAIDRGTLTASADYAASFTPGVLTVTPVRTIASTGYAGTPSGTTTTTPHPTTVSALPWSTGDGYTTAAVCFGSAMQCVESPSR